MQISRRYLDSIIKLGDDNKKTLPWGELMVGRLHLPVSSTSIELSIRETLVRSVLEKKQEHIFLTSENYY